MKIVDKSGDTIGKGFGPGDESKIVNIELEKARAHILLGITEYVPNAVVTKTIIKKSTGSISISSVDSGEGMSEKTAAFDSFIQIIEGKAEIVIDDKSTLLQSGQGIIVPANSLHFIKPNGRFKMISTFIKSSYE